MIQRIYVLIRVGNQVPQPSTDVMSLSQYRLEVVRS